MNRFFIIQNIIMLAFILAVAWAGLTFLGVLSPAVGAFLSTMFIAGTGSFGFAMDSRTDKEELWRKQWFKKEYGVEITATFVSGLFFFGLSFLIWPTLWHLFAGGSFALTIIYIWEWAYSRVIMRWHKEID